MEEDREKRIRMYVPEEKFIGTYDVIAKSECVYQLMSNDPFIESFVYGTLIEVHPDEIEDGVLEFKRITAESNYTLTVIGLPRELTENELKDIVKRIFDEGGYWEVIFGGLCYVNLPKESKFDFVQEIDKIRKLKQKDKN